MCQLILGIIFTHIIFGRLSFNFFSGSCSFHLPCGDRTNLPRGEKRKDLWLILWSSIFTVLHKNMLPWDEYWKLYIHLILIFYFVFVHFCSWQTVHFMHDMGEEQYNSKRGFKGKIKFCGKSNDGFGFVAIWKDGPGWKVLSLAW